SPCLGPANRNKRSNIMTGDLKNLAIQYFDAFSDKDLARIEGMFSEDVALKDWEIEATGKAAVLEANQNIFRSVKTIAVHPLLLIHENDFIAATIEITIDGDTVIHVVDIISFNEKHQIRSIRAYKG
ncbi:MAG: nuclear transport factor 2 family protein, partial [Betaproteobacteria bacterium]|nr:nuclear transport factor 2 family protein [Betaproteobacteria bacterium]